MKHCLLFALPHDFCVRTFYDLSSLEEYTRLWELMLRWITSVQVDFMIHFHLKNIVQVHLHVQVHIRDIFQPKNFDLCKSLFDFFHLMNIFSFVSPFSTKEFWTLESINMIQQQILTSPIQRIYTFVECFLFCSHWRIVTSVELTR